MTKNEIFRAVRLAIDKSPRNDYSAELHLQIIKYADLLVELTGKEFCEGVGISATYGTEFSKMRKIVPRLRAAGLKVDRI